MIASERFHRAVFIALLISAAIIASLIACNTPVNAAKAKIPQEKKLKASKPFVMEDDVIVATNGTPWVCGTKKTMRVGEEEGKPLFVGTFDPYNWPLTIYVNPNGGLFLFHVDLPDERACIIGTGKGLRVWEKDANP